MPKWLLPAMLMASIVIGATILGMQYRRWAWEFTKAGRYEFDIKRNFNFGIKAINEGYLNLHENDIRDDPPRGAKLDYPPLRVAVFMAWAKYTLAKNPAVKEWSAEPYSFSAPLMNGYSMLEWLGSIAAMLIVLTWLRRCAGDELSAWTGVWQATAAFLLMWFDPGVQVVGHGWPSPNVWAAPIFLLAVMFCVWECWFVAGCIIGVGAMATGQMLSVAAMFFLWPIFAGQPARAGRWVCGFVIGSALIVSGWMLSVRPDIRNSLRVLNWPAVVWVVLCMALLIATASVRRVLNWRWFLVLAAIAVVCFMWPAFGLRSLKWVGILLGMSSGLLAAIWWFDWRVNRYLIPLALGACLYLCMPLFNASTAWFDIGFRYGTERFPNMTVGVINNLPAILQHRYGWRKLDDVVFSLGSSPVTIKTFLLAMFVLTLIAACAAIAMQWRRRDRNFLVALVLPWMLFYTLCPQMIGRYAVFVAGAGAICIGRSVGMALLTFFFSLLAAEQTFVVFMDLAAKKRPPGSTDLILNPELRRALHGLTPALSWAVVLVAAIFFYVAWTSSRRSIRTTGVSPVIPEIEQVKDTGEAPVVPNAPDPALR